MVNQNNNNLIAKENYKQVEEVREINNEISSFEEFMKNYEVDKETIGSYDLEVDSYYDIRIGKRSGPMPLYRDVAPFRADFSSRADHWLYRGLFQHEDGTITKELNLRGIDEMKQALRKLENGKIKVVRKKQYREFEYEPCRTREEEVKEMLRKAISSLENDYSDYDSSRLVTVYGGGGKLMQH